MSRRFPAIPPECDSCPLPDCYPSHAQCPLQQKKKAKIANKHAGIAPKEFADKGDYHRKYSREYNQRFRRVLLRGVRIRRCDIEILQEVCAKEGRDLEQEIITLIEEMAENARAMHGGTSE